MNKGIKIAAFVCAAMPFFCSCSDDDGGFVTRNYIVNGKVEKGPFVSGTMINMQPLNRVLLPNGSTYSSIISDDLGNFVFPSSRLASPYVQLTATGYFFNEVEGRLSQGPLTLRALASVEDSRTVNVNILTHLKYDRVVNLVKYNNMSFEKANAQAQKELLTAFGLARLASKEAAKISIASGTDEAGALIAISSLILNNRSEAQVTEYLARLCKEFAEKGEFSVKSKGQIATDRDDLLRKLNDISTNVVARYKELNQRVAVKSLAYFFDWNDDGIAGNELAVGANKPVLSATEITVPKTGGEYQITVQSKAMLTLESNGLNGSNEPNAIVAEENYIDIYDNLDKPATINAEYAFGKLTLKVGQACSRNETTQSVILYDLLGNKAATVTVRQDGDSSLPQPTISANGLSYLLSGVNRMGDAMNLVGSYFDLYRGKSEGASSSSNIPFAPLTAYNENVNKAWGSFYSGISTVNRIADIDKQKANIFGSKLDVFNAVSYYNMIALWGDVPYVTEAVSGDVVANNLGRTAKDDILQDLTARMNVALNVLSERKIANNFTDMFNSSKDVPRVILANIMMTQGNYGDAKKMLNAVVRNGFYSLANSSASVADTETLLAFVTANGQSWSGDVTRPVPVITYPDVLLLLAECEHRTGRDSEAMTIINNVASAKGIELASADVLHSIMQVRQKMTNMIGFFAYMKRTGLAKSELHLQDYQLLLPIPANEVLANQALTQNPGY